MSLTLAVNAVSGKRICQQQIIDYEAIAASLNTICRPLCNIILSSASSEAFPQASQGQASLSLSPHQKQLPIRPKPVSSQSFDPEWRAFVPNLPAQEVR